MLALSPVPEEGAGCRFRVAQYVPALESAGVHVTISPFFTTEFFRLVYRRGQALKKARLFAERAVDRFRTVTQRARYDVIFIYREALPIGPPIVESLYARANGVALIYDFDDAVYLPNTSEANRAIAALKWPRKVKSIVRRSDCVIAGNEYLAAWARTYSDAVRVIPTCVDTDKFVPRSDVGRVLSDPAPQSGGVRLQPDPDIPTIGWIGTPTTVPYLLSLQSIFQDLARTHRFVLRICGACGDVQMPGVTVDNVPWTLDP